MRSTAVFFRPVKRAREAVRLRTRLHDWSSRRSATAVPRSAGWPADFDAWLDRGPLKYGGAVPDAWRARSDIAVPNPARVGVVLHVFYADLLPDLLERVRRIPVEFDLWITNAAPTGIELPDELGLLRNVRILDVDNRGRDILPLVGQIGRAHV